MSKLARALIAGTSAATLTSAASFAEPINSVEIDQDGGGPVGASDLMVLPGVETVVSVVTAQGNSTLADLIGESLIVARQSRDGSVEASSIIEADSIWSYATSTATAQANALTAAVDGDLELDADQAMLAGGSGRTSALSDLRISTYAAHTVQTAVSTANAVDVSGYGARDLTVRQANEVGATATSDLQAATAEIEIATLASVSAGNSVNAAGYGDDATLALQQDQSGAVTATADAEIGVADWGVTSTAQAAGNTARLTVDYGRGESRGVQTNLGDVTAGTLLRVGEFSNGYATGVANAVGNSVLTSTIGADASTGVDQVNRGQVTAAATLIGGYGGGSGVGGGVAMTSSAIGNAQSAYVCSECPVGLDARFTQTNGGSVLATTSTTLTGYNPAVTGAATAVGNAATFSTRTPD